ncbi:tetratricopeptide (TPR) repeat protein [Nocardioides daedukensis]|uniref:Tetratricopeptide (TPR) repeat protein n=1 Tax=Nocardioides daedukensis TaxID=634462 RepID=A0A7Y9S256_9ACTN|nr:hypothetical protein [Nocardioides daedukensis]NYG58115.1 tetratricopeptide (TPR) repeat protein [Nocardioides daedukensis]
MSMTNRARVKMRNILFLVGIIPVILTFLFVAKVGLMLSAQAAGESAYDEGDHPKAGEKFEGNKSLNLLEPWLAPFNYGTTLFQDADYEGAIKEFEAALKKAPKDERCTVRNNIALAHEVIGDGLVEDDPQAAIDSWQAGRDVLAEGDCPDDNEDSKTIDERLKKKIEQQKEQQDKDQKQDPEDDKDKKEQEQKKKELEERNDKGREERKENRDFEDYPYSEREPGYQW